MQKQFGQQLLTHGVPPVDEANLKPWMPYWYGALYVVVEGWQDLGLTDDEIDGLLTSPNVGLLKRYRHGVFHYQRTYHDRRLIDLIAEGAETASWVRQLHDAFGRWFLDWYDARPTTQQSA